jgi:hypothetical protein
MSEVYPAGGEMAWEFLGPAPHCDSPLMIAPTTDQTHMVIRMAFAGTAATQNGSFYFRSGATLPPSQYAKVRMGE